MKNFPLYLIIFMSGYITIPSFASDIKINFTRADITEARKKAGVEGKLLFIDFHAAWCSPCKWMDQTTFSDESVAKILNDNFISAKVDIDEVEGYELKNTYDVKYLPTMLIFNSQGKLLDRVEETLSPRKLLLLLQKHNAPENKVVYRHEFNTAPTIAAGHLEPGASESMQQNSEDFIKYFIKPQVQNEYRVQVGVFTAYKGANDMVNTLRQFFTEPVSVINEYKDNTPVFKVRVGQFDTMEEAQNSR